MCIRCSASTAEHRRALSLADAQRERRQEAPLVAARLPAPPHMQASRQVCGGTSTKEGVLLSSGARTILQNTTSCVSCNGYTWAVSRLPKVVIAHSAKGSVPTLGSVSRLPLFWHALKFWRIRKNLIRSRRSGKTGDAVVVGALAKRIPQNGLSGEPHTPLGQQSQETSHSALQGQTRKRFCLVHYTQTTSRQYTRCPAISHREGCS